jgi:hypothetical protein
MAINADVLQSALQELMPSYSELFVKWHPVLERVLLKGNIDKNVLTGPYREFAVVTDGPGDVTQILTGSEIVNGGRNQNAARGNTYAPRMIYAFDVPGKDLAEANGEMDLARIIQHYPELALSDFHERIAKQIVQGDGSNVGGFMTFNGDLTYNPQGTARQGVFEYAAPAAQSDTVFGIAKSSATGWYNQYEDITSFATNGRAFMRKCYYACSRQQKTLGPVDLILGDEGSYLNYVDDLDTQVQIVTDKTTAGDRAPNNIRQGIKFLDADFFLEDSLDTLDATNFSTAAARDGVMYFLNTSTWHAYTLGSDANKESKGDFSVRGPFRIPEQDLFRYEIVLNMGMHTNQLRANGVVTGGGTA